MRYLLVSVVSLVFAAGPVAFADEASQKRLLETGEAQLQSGDYQDARDTAREILKEAPKDGPALLLLGRAQTFLGHYKEAEKSLLEAETAGVRARAALGAAQYHAGSTNATPSLRKAVEEEPGNADAHYLLGLSLYKDGRYVESRESLAAARKLDASLEADTFYFGGLAALKLDDEATAKTELKQAVAVDPQSDAGKSAKETLDSLAAKARPYEVSVGLSNQYDTNVLLVPSSGGLFTPEERKKRAGNRAVFTLRGAWLPKITKEWNGIAGYGLYQSMHWTRRDVLKKFDLTHHTLTLGAAKKSEMSILTLPYSLTVANLGPFGDSARYSMSNAVSPSYVRRKGAHAFGINDSLGYENFARDEAAVTVEGDELGLTRDNLFNQLTAFYSYLFAKDRGNLTPSLGLLYANATDQSVWDYSGIRLGLQAALPVSAKWGLTLSTGVTSRTYANPYPTVDDAGVVVAEDRNDSETYLGANLGYTNKAFNFGMGTSYTRNNSTVEVFDYRRTILTVGLGAQF